MSPHTRKKARKSAQSLTVDPSQMTVAASRRRARASNRRRARALIYRIPSWATIWRQLRSLGRRSLPGVIVVASISLVIGTGYLGYQWLTQSERFAIAEFEVTGNSMLTPAQVQEILALGPDSNIFSTDMDSLETRLVADPWIASASVNRSLPNGLEIEIQEEVAGAVVELGGLYLVNSVGEPFKRADVDAGEISGLSIITGLSREGFLSAPEETTEQLVYALTALNGYHANPKRPRLGELHLDNRHGITLITYENAIAIHLGSPEDAEFEDRYRSFDSAWSALDSEEHAAARAFRIVDRTPADQVTIAFAGN